jgi:hypothetical protein
MLFDFSQGLTGGLGLSHNSKWLIPTILINKAQTRLASETTPTYSKYYWITRVAGFAAGIVLGTLMGGTRSRPHTLEQTPEIADPVNPEPEQLTERRESPMRQVYNYFSTPVFADERDEDDGFSQRFIEEQSDFGFGFEVPTEEPQTWTDMVSSWCTSAVNTVVDQVAAITCKIKDTVVDTITKIAHIPSYLATLATNSEHFLTEQLVCSDPVFMELCMRVSEARKSYSETMSKVIIHAMTHFNIAVAFFWSCYAFFVVVFSGTIALSIALREQNA